MLSRFRGVSCYSGPFEYGGERVEVIEFEMRGIVSPLFAHSLVSLTGGSTGEMKRQISIFRTLHVKMTSNIGSNIARTARVERRDFNNKRNLVKSLSWKSACLHPYPRVVRRAKRNRDVFTFWKLSPRLPMQQGRWDRVIGKEMSAQRPGTDIFIPIISRSETYFLPGILRHHNIRKWAAEVIISREAGFHHPSVSNVRLISKKGSNKLIKEGLFGFGVLKMPICTYACSH